MYAERYGGFEQVGSLPQNLTRNDVQITTEAGDIVLYSGNSIVLFYGSNTWAYTKLGHIEDLPAENLKTLLDVEQVTVSLYLAEMP
ncbi:cyclophilin-like fold protein [Intestinimonas butyriciproducens]|uniref:cyclophilin-like fold protein n=1 Tax=Intestinimonas butyriciproducens TaxID=1297617 RepID=UPI0018A9BD18|nr:cyclophilin-like fold protein [Intestinimonas butyriciproducens]MDB7817620.1 cyclophilin-like fold protein [Intestinimonas butyriciproducens]MDB7844355.1 cyclophilin-like fold protein [Intestinimonas butyriciproducens]MDB7858836.1 cyclophilin-like fold protein [Intestinimonas butyriciproducens]